MSTKITDEQLGRLWCEKHGRSPDGDKFRGHYSPWRWVCDDGPTYALPDCLWDCLPRKRFETETEAYAAVGAALRELKRRAGEIAEVLGGVL